MTLDTEEGRSALQKHEVPGIINKGRVVSMDTRSLKELIDVRLQSEGIY